MVMEYSMTEVNVQAGETKHCPICSQVLPLTEFGICRARKDGHNLYCRVCIRKKVTESRRALKQYKQIRETVQDGALYRLISPLGGSEFSVTEFVSTDRREAIVFAFLHSS